MSHFRSTLYDHTVSDPLTSQGFMFSIVLVLCSNWNVPSHLG